MLYYICWLLSAVVGAIIGNAKGRPTAGGFWGLLLGPLGWLLIASVPDERPKCAECLSAVPEGARKCRYCGSAIEQVESPQSESDLYSVVTNRSWGECIAVVVVGSFLMYVWLSSKANEEMGQTARMTFERVAAELQNPSSKSPALEAFDRIGLSQYRRLTGGMRYTEVCAIFGRMGTEVAHNSVAGIRDITVDTTSYYWTNSDGSNVVAVFQNSKLISKAQAGLR